MKTRTQGVNRAATGAVARGMDELFLRAYQNYRLVRALRAALREGEWERRFGELWPEG